MSELSAIVEQVRVATNYQKNKRSLRERIQTDLHFAHNGGLFKITPGVISFVKEWPLDELYMEDVYENPVLVDRQVFLVTAQQHYHRVMNNWHQQHAELKQVRKV